MNEWWYASTQRMTFAVQVKNGIIVAGAPIISRFIGQPAKNLGNWLRTQGRRKCPFCEGRGWNTIPERQMCVTCDGTGSVPDVTFTPIHDLTHTYAWGNNEKRETLKGRPCRIVARGSMRSVMVEFADGQHEIVSIRALRKEK